MKPEFTQVLLPQGKYSVEQPETSPNIRITHRDDAIRSKISITQLCGIITTIFILFITFGLLIVFIVRNESKFAEYENRISALEKQLTQFFEEVEDVTRLMELWPVLHDDEDEDYNTNTGSQEDDSFESDGWFGGPSSQEFSKDDNSKETKTTVFGEIKTGSSRKKRQIPAYQGPTIGPNVQRSRDGVAILEGSYSGKKDFKAVTPTESEGLRLYESLIETGGHGEPKAPEFEESEGSNLQPYHRTSAAWIEDDDGTTERGRRKLETKSGDSGWGTTGNSVRYGGSPFYVRTTSPYSQYSGATASRRRTVAARDSGEQTQNPNLIVRNSRVPSTGQYLRHTPQRSSYPYPPLKKIGQGDREVIARVHQETSEELEPEQASAGAHHAAQGESSAFAVSRSYKGGTVRQNLDSRGANRRPPPSYRKGHGFEEEDTEELNIVQAEAWAEGPKTISAHYVADPSNYTLAHRHYEGNGRLRNADGIYSSWKASDWMAGSDGSKEFILSPTGVLTVKKGGIYYIYAQIHYLDHHDINGFILQVNTEPFLQCTRMTETISGTTTKSNTCFTGGINYLKDNDRIMIRDIENNRFSIIKPEKTFFGLMRLGDIGK